MDTYIGKFIQLIRSKYLSSPDLVKPFDIGEKIQYLAIDVINGVGLGESLGDLDADNDQYQYIKSTDSGIKLGVVFSCLGILPFMQARWIGRMIGPSEKDQTGFGRVLRHVRTRIEARLKQGTENRSDMLASFVRHGLTLDELVREVLLQIIAGADTTSTGVRSILLYVLTHPRVYAKLQAEVDEAVVAGKAPPVPGIISDVEVRDLPYLQACIKEGMRVHPPAGGPFPKRVPDGGDTVMVNGKPIFLPGGTHVSYAVWPLHLDKRVYGEDAEEFRPERWLLEKDEAKLAAMHKTHDLIFGYGKYQCLGKPVALMEVNKAIFEGGCPRPLSSVEVAD
jgi:cytochrome P450